MKKFVLIFLLGLAACLAASIAFDIFQSDGIDDPGAVMRYGFPFLYQTGGDPHDDYFNKSALLADMGIALLVSALPAIFWLKYGRNTRHNL